MNVPLSRVDDHTPEVRRLADVARDTDGRVDLDALAATLGPVDVLESAAGAGWSYLIPHTGAVLSDDGSVSRLRRPTGPELCLGGDPFAALDDVAAVLGAVPQAPLDDALPPFTGGLVGALAYDLGRRIEVVPPRGPATRTTDDVWMRTTDTVVAVPPARDSVLVTARASVFESGTPHERIDHLAKRLSAAHVRPTPVRAQAPQHLGTSLAATEYQAAVRRILSAVAAGDVFQVNLSQQITARFEADTWALYRALRAHSPAAFGASLPGIGVASISPESFLAVHAGEVETRPVKGTRRRDPEAALDAALADDLATSQKDRAENVMVVDMERNDLGRVCVPGSVTVPELLRLESHPTVWHLVSAVRGRLRTDVGYGGLLRATFPCGSITGAPKVAAMRMIEELEPVRRGWYCGAIGFLGAGVAGLSVAIRTATLHDDRSVTYGAGGGVVADSDPHAEYLESLDKAVAFLRAVNGVAVGPPNPRTARRWTRRHLR